MFEALLRHQELAVLAATARQPLVRARRNEASGLENQNDVGTANGGGAKALAELLGEPDNDALGPTDVG